MKEKWKEIEGSCGRYIVSSEGRVASNYGRGKCSKTRDDSVPDGYYLLKLARENTGYSRVNLMLDGKHVVKSVHRLVIEAFVGPSAQEVNHINENKQDNRLVNLEYSTSKANHVHSLARPIERVYVDSGRVAAIYSSFKAAKEDGYNLSNINDVLMGKAETYRGYFWRYHNEFR